MAEQRQEQSPCDMAPSSFSLRSPEEMAHWEGGPRTGPGGTPRREGRRGGECPLAYGRNFVSRRGREEPGDLGCADFLIQPLPRLRHVLENVASDLLRHQAPPVPKGVPFAGTRYNERSVRNPIWGYRVGSPAEGPLSPRGAGPLPSHHHAFLAPVGFS